MLAVIPCRSTSKGIPRKNFKLCGGISLLVRAVQLAQAVTDYVVVTTDGDAEAWSIGLAHGAFVANAYPPECHGDGSKAADVWRNAWLQAETHWGKEFEWSVYLEPTSPLRTLSIVEEAIAAVHEPMIDAAWSVEPVPTRYHGMKQLAAEDGLLAYTDPVGPLARTRQELPLRFIRNGAVYVVRRRALVQGGSLLPARRTRAIVTEPLVNIDTTDELYEADRRLRECH